VYAFPSGAVMAGFIITDIHLGKTGSLEQDFQFRFGVFMIMAHRKKRHITLLDGFHIKVCGFKIPSDIFAP